MENSVLEFWNKQTDALHRHKSEEWLKKYAEEMGAMIPKGGTMLDIGCGACELTSFFASWFDQVYGVDISRSMLIKGQSRLYELGISNVKLIEGSATEIPPEIAQVDVIMAYSVVQYVDEHDLRLHLRECDRVLNPEGIVCWGLIPNAQLRHLWYSGLLDLPQPSLRSAATRYARTLRRWLRGHRMGELLWDGIGHWFFPDMLRSIADSAGFTMDMRYSWYYAYRFHALLRRNFARPAG
jgi:ubiquinone/menaquinone biosynthesis C-methylase UbiE